MAEIKKKTKPRSRTQSAGIRKSHPSSFFVLLHVKSPAANSLLERNSHLRGKPVEVLQVMPAPTDHIVVELLDKT